MFVLCWWECNLIQSLGRTVWRCLKKARNKTINTIVVFQFYSPVWFFVTLWTAAHQALLSLTMSWSLTKLMFIAMMMPSSHLILTPSSSVLNLYQHQGIFRWVSCLHQMTKILDFQLQHQSFLWVFRVDFPLSLIGLISLLSKGLSGVFSSTIVQRRQFFGAPPSLPSSSHNHKWSLRRP